MVLRKVLAIVLTSSLCSLGNYSALAAQGDSTSVPFVSAYPSLSRDMRQRRDTLQQERRELVERFASLKRFRKSNTELGHRVDARVQRLLAILEIPDLPLAARAERFAQLGIARFYRQHDLVVRSATAERTVQGLGLPPNGLRPHKLDESPDGSNSNRKWDWEQDWEDAQADAEDTIVAIESLTAEAEALISDIENAAPGAMSVHPQPKAAEMPLDLHAEFDSPDTPDHREDVACADPDSAVSDGVSDDCIAEKLAAIGEGLIAIGEYLGNTKAVQTALSNARNAVGVAMAAYTAGTLTAEGLAGAATAAITALAGTTAASWFVAAGVTVITAGVAYALWDCLAIPI